MTDKGKTALIITIVAICCLITTIVDGVIMPHYWVKFASFLLLPLAYMLYNRTSDFKRLFTPCKKGLLTALFLCVPLYILIVGGFLFLKITKKYIRFFYID